MQHIELFIECRYLRAIGLYPKVILSTKGTRLVVINHLVALLKGTLADCEKFSIQLLLSFRFPPCLTGALLIAHIFMRYLIDQRLSINELAAEKKQLSN